MKVGYKDPKETSKELFEERRREEILEEKIRELRSERDKQEGKKRAPQRSGNPKKKLKYETKNNETLGIEKKGGNSALTFTTQQLEKRKQVRPANTRAPKRVKMDMRRYVLVRRGAAPCLDIAVRGQESGGRALTMIQVARAVRMV